MRVRGRRAAAVSSRFLGRVLNVGCIGNVGVYASQNRNIGSCEGNGNNVFYHRFPFLRRVAPMCATEGAELNVLFLSKLGQENNVGTAGLQCKPLHVKTLTYCCGARLVQFPNTSFRTFSTFPLYVISSGARRAKSRSDLAEKSP